MSFDTTYVIMHNITYFTRCLLFFLLFFVVFFVVSSERLNVFHA